MNRRQFVSRVSLGAAAACTTFAKPSLAAASGTSGRVNVRFVGMMTFVERSDRSFLVATPGQHAMDHMTHVPFLMARAGSAAAKALGMVRAPGVVPAAFDTELVNTNPDEFVYRNLDNTSIEVIAGQRRRRDEPGVTDGPAPEDRAGQARSRQHRTVGLDHRRPSRRQNRKLSRASRRGQGLVVRRLFTAPHGRRQLPLGRSRRRFASPAERTPGR